MIQNKRLKAIEIIRSNGGNIQMSEAISKGISRTMLYTLLEDNVIEKISRGFYRLKEMESLTNPDFVTVALRAPSSVICLTSALSFHDITTQISRKIHLAFVKKSAAPLIENPPIQVHWFSKESFQAGIETHNIDDVTVKIYNPEKTIVDCFKFRDQIGIDVFIESVKLYRARKRINIQLIVQYARICRVYKSIIPYIESIL
jgi:predicted transcriptional regulator of viral defense system